jgi:tetratricopeptide (TPR) repeat protein
MQFHIQSLTRWSALTAWFLLPLMSPAASSAEVKFSVESQVIPTYEVGPADPNPRFYSGRTYQGAKATFYPYPVTDRLTHVKTNKAYQTLWLENPYIKISIIPELGGRIFSATDKSNGYEFFYRQHVIKPALIGMLGAWISGGVEFNVPHHHRATSFMPVDWTVQTNANKSVTAWIGEIELRHRLKWMVGMTLHPDRSYIEMTAKMFNRTPFATPILFWINPAVHVDEHYQVVFPPSTEWAVQHSKPEFASWPIARQRYGGVDYTRGVDISWWKNHPAPVSFFAWNYTDDWFGGYDHGKQAGVIQVADHHVAPGKKFFAWGNGPEGETWSKILTDDDGPYLELMAGAWSDNQPDYSWLQPGETREWKHYWYPVRNLGTCKMANTEAAVNLEFTNKTLKVLVNTTVELKDAAIHVSHKGNTIFQQKATLRPNQPFTATTLFEKELPLDELKLTVFAVDHRQVITYQPTKPKGTPMPKPVERPKPPQEYKTMDELYFTGQRVEQLYSPSFEAEPYYQEMLNRDAGDSLANTAMGILRCKQWRWEEAEKYLRASIARSMANYVRPKNNEAFYFLGVTLKAQQKYPEAREAFGQAIWSQAWKMAAQYELAELYCLDKQYQTALEHVQECLNANQHNIKALGLKTTIQRYLNQVTEFEASARLTLAVDPLNVRAQYELGQVKEWTSSAQPGLQRVDLVPYTRGDPQAYLELATEYAAAGFCRDALTILDACTAASKACEQNPMIAYAKKSYCMKADLKGVVKESIFDDAIKKTRPDIYFPCRFEDENILLTNLRQNSKDALALYNLGTLLYDHQPLRAIGYWENSAKIDPTLYLVHRNLALAYAQHQKNIPNAIAAMAKSLARKTDNPRLYYENDLLCEAGSMAVTKRLAPLAKHQSVVELRDDATTRLIIMLTANEQYDRALELLTRHRFSTWEGSREIHDIYVDACVQRGHAMFRKKQDAEALRDYEAALLYPENLQVGRSYKNPRESHIQYLIGTVKAATGNATAAQTCFKKAVDRLDQTPGEYQYYQALALRQLGRAEDARKIFEALISAGQEQASGKERADYFAKFGEKRADCVRQADALYLEGLGQLGLGKTKQATAIFKKALVLHPAHLGVLHALRH